MIDAGGCYVFPGVVDPHTHIQLDTGIYKTADNWEIGTRTAAFGGVTTVIDFATQFPGMTFPEALEARLKECEPALIDYGLHMMVTDLPRDPDEARRWLEALRDLGVPSIKLYTTYRPNYYADDATLLHTFRAMPKDMIAMVHCENDAIVTDATQRLVEAGQDGLGVSWAGAARPKRNGGDPAGDVSGQRLTEAPIYIVHCSTMQSIRAVFEPASRPGCRPPVSAKPAHSISCWMTAAMTQPDAEQFILQPPLRPKTNIRFDLPCWCRQLSARFQPITATIRWPKNRNSPNSPRLPAVLPGLETSFHLTYTYGVHLPVSIKSKASLSRSR